MMEPLVEGPTAARHLQRRWFVRSMLPRKSAFSRDAAGLATRRGGPYEWLKGIAWDAVAPCGRLRAFVDKPFTSEDLVVALRQVTDAAD
ncbi:MAG: hypothetical protein JXX28_12450 [Deltaproteobacteria bacterium]|nr:hypothetical protein [Deltaproteobacteria bacterium]